MPTLNLRKTYSSTNMQEERKSSARRRTLEAKRFISREEDLGLDSHHLLLPKLPPSASKLESQPLTDFIGVKTSAEKPPLPTQKSFLGSEEDFSGAIHGSKNMVTKLPRRPTHTSQ